jgi:two-component system OmpR family response regulator
LRALLIIHDPAAGRRLADALRGAGVAVVLAASLEWGEAAAKAGGHDAVALDLTGWEAEALDVLARWRRGGLSVPVLLLTSGADCGAGVRGLERGGDSFLNPVLGSDAVLAHLRALARRAWGQVAPPVLRVHDLEIDAGTRAARRGGREVVLTATEYALLQLLAQNRGEVCSRRRIEEHLYGSGGRRCRATVPTCVAKLRGKIDRGFDLPLVLTRRGQGYLLRGG